MASLFAHVWSTGDVVLARSLKGGASELPKSLAGALGNRVVLEAEVHEVAHDNGLVRARYVTRHRDENVLARAAIVTTTPTLRVESFATFRRRRRKRWSESPTGPWLMSILTNETRPMPWDDVYSILVVGRSFSVRRPGGTLMVYAGAGLARKLFEKSDDGIKDTMLSDLAEIYPESREIVEDVLVQRWTRTVPYASPGRHLLQQALEGPEHRSIFLAGDYIGAWTDIESAATTGLEAANKVRDVLRAPPRTYQSVA